MLVTSLISVISWRCLMVLCCVKIKGCGNCVLVKLGCIEMVPGGPIDT